MGIILRDSPTSKPRHRVSTTTATSWDDVPGLEPQQRRKLSMPVLWTHPQNPTRTLTLRLSHGGDVASDGNCLFSAAGKSVSAVETAAELRRKTVRRFREDYEAATEEEKQSVDAEIKNMYTPDVDNGWGVSLLQEVKFLVRKSGRIEFDHAILELLSLGLSRESAAESIYKERCVAVVDGPSWAKYMSISGSPDDEYDIITLQYTVEGLLSVDENRDGRAAAFGDDIAIKCLATEFQREIYVAQAHGSDAMVDEDNCVFFLPHRPTCEITEPPIFLFMKGTGWCAAGGDHYEPLIAHPTSAVSKEKVGFVL